jgi:hypothetical protein
MNTVKVRLKTYEELKHLFTEDSGSYYRFRTNNHKCDTGHESYEKIWLGKVYNCRKDVRSNCWITTDYRCYYIHFDHGEEVIDYNLPEDLFKI